MKARRSLGAVGIVLVATLVAACGGDGGETTPSITLGITLPTTTAPTGDTTTTLVEGSTSEPPTTEVPVTTVAGSDVPTSEVPSSEVPSTTTPTTGAPVPPASTGAPTTTAALDSSIIALELVAKLEAPVDLAWRKGDDTLFIVEQDGLIVPLRDGTVGKPVLDITALTSADGERGLLGLAFAADGKLAYIDHTDNRGDTVIAEYAVGTDGTFDPASRREVLAIDQPYPNHNGGNVMFGPDGMLYIGMGDGGAGGDPERRALDVGELLGKILRIDPHASGDAPYTIPADNPFVGVAGARPEIWSVGVRNPWRMSFDRSTGDLWIADVGQNQWEEIDAAWADEGAGRGLNFGWSALEGTHRYNVDQSIDGTTPPIYEYPHRNDACSVSGGAVYRGSAIPSLVGWYVFSDFCGSRVNALQVVDKVFQDVRPIAPSSNVSAVREGPDGELYVLSLDGSVSRIVPA